MSLSSELSRYLRWLAEQRAYATQTVKLLHSHLSYFLHFAQGKGVEHPSEITRDLLDQWAEELTWRLTPKGQPIRTVTRFSYLSALRGFLRFLFQRDLTLVDLSSWVVLPKCPKRLPGLVFEHGEVMRMIERAADGNPVALRDRALLEVLYSTGLRASELGRLRLEEVNHEDGIVFVRQGKGGKDRVVPIGKKACEAIRAYLVSGRSQLLQGPDPGTLLLNLRGRPMSKWTILPVVKRHARRAGLQKHATTHAFRRTCATLMLADGANIKAVQDILGHECLETTAVYLKVSAKEIKQEHEKHHPREKATPAGGSEPHRGEPGE